MNTFSSAMLLNENYVEPSIINSVSLNHNLFNESLSFVLDITNEMNISKMQLNKAILEANGNQIIIQESFDGFVDKVKKIIDKFLEFIKKIFKKFVIMLNKLVKSDKYIKKHKDDIKKFDGEFDIKGYKYTNIDSDEFPNINAYNTYKNIVGEKITDYTDLAKTTTDILSANKTDTEDWYGSFRGQVIGNGNLNLTASEYNTELFEKFRNQESTPDTITVSNIEVQDSLNRFIEYDKTVRHIEKLRNELEKQYKNIKKEVAAIKGGFENNEYITNYYDNPDTAKHKYNTLTDADKKKVDDNSKLMIDLKVNQIQKMCSIHSTAFSAKLEAVKECYVQDKKILYKALKETTKKSTNEDTIMIPESVDTLLPPVVKINLEEVE